MADSGKDVQISSLSLKIKSESNAAIKGLDKLRETLNKLKSVSTGKNLGLNGLKELSSSLARLKSVTSGMKLSSAASGINKIGEAVASLNPNSGGLSNLIESLQKLSDVSKSLPAIGAGLRDIKSGIKQSKAPKTTGVDNKTITIGDVGIADDVRGKIGEISGPAMDLKERLKDTAEVANRSFSEIAEKFLNTTSHIELLEMKLGGLKEKLGSVLEGGAAPDSASKIYSLVGAIGKLEGEIETLKNKAEALNSVKNIMDVLPPEFSKVMGDRIKNGFEGAKWAVNAVKDATEDTKRGISGVSDAFRRLGRSSYEAIRPLKPMFAPIISGFNNLKNAAYNAGNNIERFFGRVGSIALYRSIRAGISFISNGIKEGISNVYQYSKAIGGPFASSMDRLASNALKLKNSLGSMFAPLVSALLPTINWIIEKISTLFNYINQFVSALSGKSTWLKARDYSVEYAKSAEKASKASVKAGKAATKSAKQVADAVKKATLGIDELNIIQRKKSSFNSPVGDIGGAIVSSGPDFSGMFEEVPISDEIQKNLERIEALVWASLFAVGLIFMFTGHPLLGLGFMIAGAYKFAQKADVNWGYLQGALKQIMDGPIGMFTTITSALALLIGFILLGSGVKPEWGLGLVAAGAVGLGLKAAAHWDYLSKVLQGPVGLFTTVAGSTAVVFGAALLMSGARPELGLALIAFGLTGIGTVAAANWDWLSEKLKGPLGLFLKIAGATAVLFGSALLFSGINQGLGLGLIILGLTGITLGESPDWSFMPNQMSKIFKDVAAVFALAGIAAVAIGIILMCTTIGFNIGLSLVLSGAAGIIGGVSANWDAISNAISDMFRPIKNWFNSNPWALIALGVLLCATILFFDYGVRLIGEGVKRMFSPAPSDDNALKDKVAESVSGMSKEMDRFNSAAEGKVQTSEEIFRKAGEAIPGNFKSGLEETIPETKTPIMRWSNDTGKWFMDTGIRQNFRDNSKSVVSEFSGGIKRNSGASKTPIMRWSNDTGKWFMDTKIGNNFENNGKSIVNSFGGGVKNNYGLSKTPITKWSGSTSGWFSGTGVNNNFYDSGKGIVRSFNRGIYDNMDSTSEYIGALRAFSYNSVEELVKAGDESAMGFLEGMRRKLGDSKYFYTLSMYGVKGFKKYLEVRSPSRVYMDIGEQSGEGYNIGLKNKMKETAGVIEKWGNLVSHNAQKLVLNPDPSSLRYDINDYEGSVSTEINGKTRISISGLKEGIESFYKEQLLPIITEIAEDMRRQADKEEKTVVQIGGRTIEQAVTAQRSANGYNFLG